MAFRGDYSASPKGTAMCFAVFLDATGVGMGGEQQGGHRAFARHRQPRPGVE